MGSSRGYYQSATDRAEYIATVAAEQDKHTARIADARHKLAAKIVMALVDKIVAEVVRPGPVAEERECYEMAGEVRAITPELEMLVKQIIDVEGGVK